LQVVDESGVPLRFSFDTETVVIVETVGSMRPHRAQVWICLNLGKRAADPDRCRPRQGATQIKQRSHIMVPVHQGLRLPLEGLWPGIWSFRLPGSSRMDLTMGALWLVLVHEHSSKRDNGRLAAAPRCTHSTTGTVDKSKWIRRIIVLPPTWTPLTGTAARTGGNGRETPDSFSGGPC
jgi:hypothetical protein